jgi:hypothetical protein
MEDDLIDAPENLLIEGMAIVTKPKEGIALKTLTAYGKSGMVMVALPLWITLGGPPTISQAPAPQADVPPHVASQSQETVTQGPQGAAYGGSGSVRITPLAGHARLSGGVLTATLS